MESLDILLETGKKSYSQDEKLALAETKNKYYQEYLKILTPADILPGAKELMSQAKTQGLKQAIGT